MTDSSSAAAWTRPIAHWSTDPFTERTTIHGLASDEVRSALHKHVRAGRAEQAVRAAIELARTDPEHEAEMWRRLQVLAAEDVGSGDPMAIVVVRALHEAALDTDEGSYDRLVYAAQAAGHLATSEKNPVFGEMMQVVLHESLAPEIPDEALCVHTRRGQLAGRTMYDWFMTGTAIVPEASGRDVSYRDRLADVYLRLDPPLDE